MLLYAKIADHFNIVDKPNERSSHNRLIIRGGGIIFLVAAALVLFRLPELWLPVSALFIIGFISFLDDRFTLSNKLRIGVHLIAVSVLFYYLNIYSLLPVYGIIVLYILVIGIINAYNFMDGINGITGAYSLVILGGLQYINLDRISFIEPDVIWLPMLACFVFLYFNFRRKARCFAGDVGSVSIAFWIIWVLIKLILVTQNPVYILFLAVYGVDSILTIIHRLILRQNIFEAHRLHFYQLLVNELQWPHLLVSTIYAFIQFIIIVIVIQNPDQLYIDLLVCLLPLSIVYVLLKPQMMKLKSSAMN